jgi:N-acetylglucosamine kinase-like BadF-type ATPase
MWYFRKMRWIVDSGGTKSSWINENGLLVDFEGINPNIHSSESIEHTLVKAKSHLQLSKSDTFVWYGAGCSSKSSVEKLEKCFFNLGLEKIDINHDLLAACRAVLGSDSGIVGILGTGSNACFYDGARIVKEKVSLGYVMGDEGGGAYFGKRLLQDFVNGTMPKTESDIFTAHFPGEPTELISAFYSSSKASAHLGQYAKVLPLFDEESAYKKRLLHSGFDAYNELFINPLRNTDSNKIGFVGTVATIYSKELKDLIENQKLEWVGVCQNPIKALLEWHNSNEIKLE